MTKTNFMQVIEQTHEEKVAMYMKFTKSELIAMLIQCNLLLRPERPFVNPMKDVVITRTNGTGLEDYPCMHLNCPGCKNGTCSGAHMISCPCPRCSPRC